ncbi:MerR family transcriptional regulator [Streptomyces zagrosensis]|uniref:DNA-binding transcriptional MerR regulator n=1 Tax=Streptomyces zagrosensis TaxID=1042984 RepID=A0A7W9UXE1_9ACTN|nr:MerR family transcriptional regulator [Streptomyces zagrosensis]MBB5934803.1 DNA-binding transcriptional MerR regulator [Streptomyces zagrosensis]
MRIGELARRTGVSTRLLRYYEEQGLLAAERDSNDYRRYAPDVVHTVQRVRELLATGLNTQAIREVLPCTQSAGPGVRECAHFTEIVDGQLSKLDGEIAELQRRRAALTDYAALSDAPASPVTAPAPAPASASGPVSVAGPALTFGQP